MNDASKWVLKIFAFMIAIVLIGSLGNIRNLCQTVESHASCSIAGTCPSIAYLDYNNTGDLNISGNATINLIYGSVWFHNDTGVSIGTLNNTYQTLEVFDIGEYGYHLNGFTRNSHGITLVSDPGYYMVTWSATGSGTNNHIYHGGIFNNEVQDYGCNDHVYGLAQDEVILGKSCIINIDVGEELTIKVRDTNSTSSGKAYLASIAAFRLGD